MSLKNRKKYIQNLFNSFGYEIKKCQVRENNKYKWLQDYNINTIFDIGANTGGWAGYIYDFFPKACIYSYEPLNDCFSSVEKKARKISNIKAYNFALGEKTGKFTIFRSSQASSSSLLEMGELHKEAFPKTSEISQEEITVKRLDDVAKDLEIKENIFIKIDVQGYELNVIHGGKELIQKSAVLLVETSFQTLYEEQPLFNEVFMTLTKLGFKFMGDFESIKNPLDGSILQSNAIFINKIKL